MEGLSTYTPEGPEEDDDDSTDAKKSKRRERVGHIVASAEKVSSDAGKTNKQEEVARKTAPLLGGILGGERASGSSQEKSTDDEKRGESDPELSTAEEHAATELAEGRPVDLSDIEAAHDEAIIRRAVEKAVPSPHESESTESLGENTVVPEGEAALEETTEDPETAPEPTADNTTSPEATAATPLDDSEDIDDGTTMTPSTHPTPSRPVSAHSGSPSSASSSSHSASSGGGRPPTTPPVAPSFPGSPPSSPPRPRYRSAGSSAPFFPSVPTSPNLYTAPLSAAASALGAPEVVRALSDAENDAFRRGRNRGLVAGLIVGGGIEHIRHRRREKNMERKFSAERKEQAKKIENMRWDHIREAETAKVLAAAAEKHKAVEQAGIPPIVAAKVEAGAPSLVQLHVEAPNRRTETKVDSRENSVAKQHNVQKPEQKPIPNKAEQIELARQREQIVVPPSHRVERSAWHSVEVDEHGRPVQESTFEYGHEYYQERAHEANPKTKQVKRRFDEATGEVALVAAALTGETSAGGVQTTPGVAGGIVTESVDQRMQAAIKDMTTLEDPKLLLARNTLKSAVAPPKTPTSVAIWFVVLIILLIIMAVVIL